jgi:ABC-type nitrate/sulfonate/bicarbonate transport system substrate-binding protein
MKRVEHEVRAGIVPWSTWLLPVVLLWAVAASAAEPMGIGISTQPSAALLQIAAERGLFAAHGIDARISRYPSGKRAMLDGLFTGAADVVSAADTPVVANAFSRQDFAVLAAIFQADDVNRIIARRDAGIAVATDLRGKTIGTQRASAVHYFLHLFLAKHRIRHDEVTAKFLKAEELPEALAAGDIDAFSMREPFIGQAHALLGDNAIVFEEPRLFPQYELLLVRRDYLLAHPETIRGLLRALGQAAVLMNEDAAAMTDLIARYIGGDDADVAEALHGWRPRLFLDQGMLLAMEFEAEWIIDDGLTDQSRIPNLLRIIDPEPLAEVDPDAVTMNR